MTEPTVVPEVFDLRRLRAHLVERGVAVEGELRATEFTGGRSNLTFRIGDGKHDWVVRRPPIAGVTPSAHNVAREYRIVDALQGNTIPLASTVLSCADRSVLGAPFIVVGFVPGRVLRTRADLADVADAELGRIHRELLRVLVELHAVPYREVGLADFGRPEGFYQRQVRRWRQQWDHVATRELADLDRLHRALDDRVPARQEPTIVHGDFRVDNTILDPADLGRMRALVDWELATLGDPITDLATMCVYQHPDFDHVVGEPAASTSPRWPGTEAIAADYAARSGRDLAEFHRYLGLAYFKLAVIAEGIVARYRLGAGRAAGHSTAGVAVPGLLAAGLAVLNSPF